MRFNKSVADGHEDVQDQLAGGLERGVCRSTSYEFRSASGFFAASASSCTAADTAQVLSLNKTPPH